MTAFENLPPLATLVAFEAAHRHRSFTRAADELFTSQATISRRVRELEADLGVSLFERGRYDVNPTTEAETLVASVRLSLRELSATADQLRRRSSENRSLTILASLSLASAIVAPVLGEMQRRHPELNVRVLSGCEPIETTTEDFDVALQYGPSESKRFHIEFIAEEAVYPVCAPALAEQLPTPVTAQDLAALPLLHVEYDDPSWTTWETFLGSAEPDDGDDPTDGNSRGLVFTSYQVCLDVAERGDGIALGWERSVRPRLADGTLVRIPGITVPDAGRINAYLPNDEVAHPNAAELLALLKAVMERP